MTTSCYPDTLSYSNLGASNTSLAIGTATLYLDIHINIMAIIYHHLVDIKAVNNEYKQMFLSTTNVVLTYCDRDALGSMTY